MAPSTPPGGAADNYALPRDSAESARLDAQHAVWKRNIAYPSLLHPSILSSLRRDARIADVGTGTGVWLLDLAGSLDPSTAAGYSFVGLDMSPAQYQQAQATAPSNVSFTALNVLDAVPDALRGSFDVLHLRLLVLGLPAGTWPVAVMHLLQLLRPGGWVQWEEADFAHACVLQLVPNAHNSAAEQSLSRILAAARALNKGIDDAVLLPRLFASALAESKDSETRVEVYSSDRDAASRAAFNATLVGAFAGMARMFAAEEGEGSFWAGEEARRLLEGQRRDVEEGRVYYRVDLRVTIARLGWAWMRA